MRDVDIDYPVSPAWANHYTRQGLHVPEYNVRYDTSKPYTERTPQDMEIRELKDQVATLTETVNTLITRIAMASKPEPVNQFAAVRPTKLPQPKPQTNNSRGREYDE
jgi:hypothetical protein